MARVALIRAGLPVSVAGTTVNPSRSSAAGHRDGRPPDHLGGADAAIGGGLESISMMKRDGDRTRG
jgi:hypothetical protein